MYIVHVEVYLELKIFKLISQDQCATMVKFRWGLGLGFTDLFKTNKFLIWIKKLKSKKAKKGLLGIKKYLKIIRLKLQ